MRFKNKKIAISILSFSIFLAVVMAGSASAKTIYVKDESHYGTLLNKQVQSLMDATESGDTINFMGLTYKNLQITVNNNLNIISTIGTSINSSSGTAVFLINGPQASGTKINGFTIKTDANPGIYVKNANNVVISDNQVNSTQGTAIKLDKSSNSAIRDNNISGSTTGVKIENSYNTQITGNNITHNQEGVVLNNASNTTIDNNNISNNKGNGLKVEKSVSTTINHSNIGNNDGNGVEILNSNKTVLDNSTVTGNGKTSNGNGVSIKSSDKVLLSHCYINHNYAGIYSRDVSDLILVYNFILNNNKDSLKLSGHANNVQIFYNIIKGNLYGIKLDSSSENLTIVGNLITGQLSDRLDPHTGSGISFESNYIQKNTNIIEHNAIYSNKGKNIDARNSNDIYDQLNRIPIGSNWYGSNNQLNINVCCMVKTSATQMKIIRTGYNTYAVIFVDGDTGEIESDLPSIRVRISKNDVQQVQNVLTDRGVANGVLTANNNNIAWVSASAGDSSVYAELNMAISSITEKYSVPRSINYGNWAASGGNNGEGGGYNGEGNTPGSGNGGSDINPQTSSGTTSNNGASSVGMLTLGTAVAASSAGSSSSSDASTADGNQESKTAQELIVDEISQNSPIWGIIAIILLLIIVAGAYYRNDIKIMFQNSKK